MAEAIGLALAVLPLIISAAEHYREGLDTIQSFRSKIGDDRMLEFYEEVAFEIYILRSSVKRLVKDLPGISLQRKRDLLSSVKLESWSDKNLSDALQRKLGEVNYPIFEMTLSRLLLSLNILVSGNQRLISSFETVDENIFCDKLIMLRMEIVAGNTLSTLRNRVKFVTSQHKRSKHLSKITKYNERLQQILEGSAQADIADFDLRTKFPSPKLRAAAQNLHDTLSRSWICSCDSPHEQILSEAKLCIKCDPSSKSSFEFSFDIFFTTQPEKDTFSEDISSWQESVIHIAPPGQNPSKTQSKEVGSICELVEVARGHNVCVQMLLSNNNLWQIRSQAKRLHPVRNVSLETILRSSTKRCLREKRILAVTLAKTVLQMSEGPWLRKRWTPAQISFCETTENAINFERPYLSTKFKDGSSNDEDSIFDAQTIHSIPSLVSLGKMLLEIDQGRPIEISPLDLTDGKFPNPNTELTATLRFFKETADNFYVNYGRAVKACLEPTFLRMDQIGGLEEEEVRQLVYEHVVVPLETELYSGFKVRVSGF